MSSRIEEVSGSSPEELAEAAEARYKEAGLITKRFEEEPGRYHEPHAHEGSKIFTTAGSVQVRLGGGDWQVIGSGQELIIGDDQLHEIQVGDEGWSYVFACSEQEARRQEIIQ